MIKLKIQEFYQVISINDKVPIDDDKKFYFKASDRFFDLNQPFVLKEIDKLPPEVKRISERDTDDMDIWRPTVDFYNEIIAVKTEFGDDITLFLKNGYIVSSYWNYIPEYEFSIPTLNFFTLKDIERLDVSDNKDDMDDVAIVFL